MQVMSPSAAFCYGLCEQRCFVHADDYQFSYARNCASSGLIISFILFSNPYYCHQAS